MPTVTFSKKALMELLGRKISDEQLIDRLCYMGTGFEGMNDDELTLDIFANRPDLLSEQGLARALSQFLGIKPGFRKYSVKRSGIKVIVDASVKKIRPFTACAIVKGLKLTDERIKELIKLQEKLHITYGRNRKKAAIGIYPLEHIRPPIYYKALNPEEIKFKPLDLNKDLTGSQILAIHPTGRELAHLLEGKDKYPVFIDAKFQFMSMPPIINSNTTGKVTTSTKDVFIECSGFDFDYLHTCLNIIVTALADIGGDIYSVDVYYPDKKRLTPDLEGTDVKLDMTYVNKVLGLDLKDADFKKLLERMGHAYANKTVTVPSYRSDILHPIDIVEDVAIAYGYENFESTISAVATTGAERPIEIFKNKIRELLIGLGLVEVKNFHITSREGQTKLMNYSGPLVELSNSLIQDSDVLRSWITPSLMENLRYNKHYEYPQNIFEIGTIFKLNDNYDTNIQETEVLAIALCGNDANYTKIKQVSDALMEALDIKSTIQDTEHTSFIKGRVSRLLLNDEKIAYIGELHPQVLMNWTLEMPVAVLELNVSDLFRIMNFPQDVDASRSFASSEKISSEQIGKKDKKVSATTKKISKPKKIAKPKKKKR